MPDLAPWLPLLAIPFDAEVLPTPEADALDPAASREQAASRRVETFLERVLMMPTLLVFEDAHWLDDASRFLLRHLTAQPAHAPWLVCVTTRPGGRADRALDGPAQRARARSRSRPSGAADARARASRTRSRSRARRSRRWRSAPAATRSSSASS